MTGDAVFESQHILPQGNDHFKEFFGKSNSLLKTAERAPGIGFQVDRSQILAGFSERRADILSNTQEAPSSTTEPIRGHRLGSVKTDPR